MFQSTPLREGRLRATPRPAKSSCFNPRPCARGDLRYGIDGCSLVMFQSTPLREGRLRQYRRLYRQGLFQSTPLREGRPMQTSAQRVRDMFQSTPLREGRRDLSLLILAKTSFNPRPCARGDAPLRYADPRNDVSIHAPARGATTGAARMWRMSPDVSIHAPARGATAGHRAK